jgi:hypothetical protein
MGSHKCAPVSYAATAQSERLPLSRQVAANPEGSSISGGKRIMQ